MSDGETIDAGDLMITPVGFAERMLGMVLYWWQAAVLTWFENTLKRTKGSLCTPNGSGKSSVCIPALGTWWITVHPKGRVVITTKDSKQLDNQIWPALTTHKPKFPKWRWIERAIYNEHGGYIIGFTTDEPGRAEGWHKLDDFDGPLLIIADESKSIPDDIFQAIDRCRFNALFLLSSPGLTEGRFWESQGQPDSENVETDPQAKGFRHLRIGLSDCPHIEQDRIEDIRGSYPEGHWFPRSTLDGLFTDADDDSWFVFNKAAVKRAMNQPPAFVNGRHRAFLDFAAGRAENVEAYRKGNEISLTCFRDKDPMAMIGRFIIGFEAKGLAPSEIKGDEGGMGIPIVARFREAGWPITPVRNEEPCPEPRKYENMGAYQWIRTAERVMAGELILPNDPVLYKQLTTRKVVPTSDGRMGVESKKEMKKRGLESPDRGDAVCGVGCEDQEFAGSIFDETGLRRMEGAARVSRPEGGALTMNGVDVVYEAGARDAWLQVWERPRPGARYLCVVNPIKFDDPAMTDHVVLVLREKFYDEQKRKEVPSRLVARIRRPLRLDATPLADLVRRVSVWYGFAFCVPVANDRGDVIDALQAAGVHIYTQEDFETVANGRRNGITFGWESDDYSRSLWIGSLADAIRTDTLDCEDLETVMQMYQLSAANAATMRNAEAVGVGLKCMNYASTFAAPVRQVWLEGNGTGSRVDLSRTMFS